MGTYTDASVTPGDTNAYTVSAVNSAGESPQSSPPVSITVPIIGSTRDPKLRPFTVGAWPNVSGGTGATVVNAGLGARTAHVAVKAQEIPMNMDPSQPLAEVFKNVGQTGNRCASLGPFSPPIFVPFNQQLVVPSASDNYPSAFLGDPATHANARFEGGNFAHCGISQDVTSGHFGNFGTIIDNATGGASGGSGISTLAGTIRYLEFTHGTYGDMAMVAGTLVPAIRHVLRVDLAVFDLSALNGSGFAWPANRADSGATTPGDPNFYSSTVRAAVEGALFVLPQTLNLASLGLTTIPGKQFAWTLQQYGMRPCNTQHGSTWAFATEWSMAGRVSDEFQNLYGFSMDSSPTEAFGMDMNRIIVKMGVITNDGPNSIGGPGTRLQPPAPPLAA